MARTNAAATATATTADRATFVRKIGDRRETIIQELSPEQIATESSNVLDLLGRRDNLDAARKAVVSEYKAKIEAIDNAIREGTKAATTGKRSVEVDVQLWLNSLRQVVTVRIDGDGREIEVTRRTARTDELQEALDISFPPPDEAFR